MGTLFLMTTKSAFNKQIFKIAFVLLLSLLAPSLVFSQNEDKITVEFWHGMGGRHGRTVNEIAEKFNSKQDKYYVRAIYQGKYSSLSQKLIASLYAKRNPAISQMYPSWASRYFKYGYLQPVEGFIAKDPDFNQEDLDDFYKVMLEENTLKDPKTKIPVLTALPFNKSVYILYVNQTRMKACGWDQPPKTWEEFSALAKAMTVIPEGTTRPTFYGFASRPYIESFTVQAFSADTLLFDEDKEEVLIDGEKGKEAFEFLKKMTSGEGKNQIGYVESDYLSSAFGSEQIGMFVSSTASFPYNDMAVGNKFIWMAYQVPSKDENTQGKTLMQGTNLGIFNNVSEEKQQGAWEFMKFITSAEMTALWAMHTGYMPVRKSARQDPEFKAYLEENERYANAVDTLENAFFEPRVIYWESVRNIISQEVEAVLQGRKETGDALKEMRAQIEQTVKRADK
jgi:multiple sugar transport system substrate-binding protein